MQPMGESGIQVTIAFLGIAGTLSAALLTQMLAGRSERRREAIQRESKWHVEQVRLDGALVKTALSLERDLWSVAAFLSREPGSPRLPGYTSILLVPKGGIPGVLEAVDHEILFDAIEDAYSRLDSMEELVAEICLIGTQAEGERARDLHEALWEAAGDLESFVPFDQAADDIQACRSARDRFISEARQAIGRDSFTASDRRPREAEAGHPTFGGSPASADQDLLHPAEET